ncbi:MAG: class I SAM-dependent methyltransferase [bacterium]|nr:class I SAM-dependent methyltransferase [bacterium]
MRSPIPLRCFDHQEPIQKTQSNDAYSCSRGCNFPIVAGVPRFVSSDNYASSFGLQWNVFRTTQLDSHTGIPISQERLERLLGGDFSVVKDRVVLEAGCGAGRFTEVLLASGSRVFASDLSQAVEANVINCGDHPNLFVCQADLHRLPVPDNQFDVVLCVGVLQHTPNPEDAITALSHHVKPGGLLVIDHYMSGQQPNTARRLLRRFLLKRTPRFCMLFCRILVSLLWPIHRLTWAMRAFPVGKRIHGRFAALSPVADYQAQFQALRSGLLREWAMLDTHDMLTDVHKHTRTAEEIAQTLKLCGLEDIFTACAGNGVEARAHKPQEPV